MLRSNKSQKNDIGMNFPFQIWTPQLLVPASFSPVTATSADFSILAISSSILRSKFNLKKPVAAAVGLNPRSPSQEEPMLTIVPQPRTDPDGNSNMSV